MVQLHGFNLLNGNIEYFVTDGYDVKLLNILKLFNVVEYEQVTS